MLVSFLGDFGVAGACSGRFTSSVQYRAELAMQQNCKSQAHEFLFQGDSWRLAWSSVCTFLWTKNRAPCRLVHRMKYIAEEILHGPSSSAERPQVKKSWQTLNREKNFVKQQKEKLEAQTTPKACI